mmetsp:Transcript_5456/g.7896  ORF Transcript_5456/g.7896 Transcript_5456/m.7896 type:complete len:202 (-) Transcript_5456:714-1319(-)
MSSILTPFSIILAKKFSQLKVLSPRGHFAPSYKPSFFFAPMSICPPFFFIDAGGEIRENTFLGFFAGRGEGSSATSGDGGVKKAGRFFGEESASVTTTGVWFRILLFFSKPISMLCCSTILLQVFFRIFNSFLCISLSKILRLSASTTHSVSLLTQKQTCGFKLSSIVCAEFIASNRSEIFTPQSVNTSLDNFALFAVLYT